MSQYVSVWKVQNNGADNAVQVGCLILNKIN